MSKKKGLTGNLYEINVLPSTVRELVDAIYNQPGFTNTEAFEIADYFDDKYNISPNVPVNKPEPKL